MPTPTRFPRCLATSQRFRVAVGGQPATVLTTSAGEICQWEHDGPVEVRIAADRPIKEATVRPLARRIQARIVDGEAVIAISQPGQTAVEIDGQPVLYLLAEPPEEARPDPKDPRVRYFAGGQVHEVGELALSSGQILYLEAGAVLRGAILVSRAQDVRLCGRGIIDNSFFSRGNPDGTRRPLLIEHSEGVRVEGLIFIEPATWTIQVAACRAVDIGAVKIFGSLIASDGIDIVGSEAVRVHDCLIRTADDCVALKSVEYARMGEDDGYCRDVRDVTVERCLLHSYGGGSALEIGFELRCAEVCDVVFRDLDILGVHEWGAAIAIHNTDQAVVHRILYEDIRVEHYWVWLFDVRIVDSRYARSAERGHIRDITVRRLDVTVLEYNLGVSTSHFGGYDHHHRVERVRFEDCRYAGKPMRSLDDFDGYARHADGIVFSTAAPAR